MWGQGVGSGIHALRQAKTDFKRRPQLQGGICGRGLACRPPRVRPLKKVWAPGVRGGKGTTEPARVAERIPQTPRPAPSFPFLGQNEGEQAGCCHPPPPRPSFLLRLLRSIREPYICVHQGPTRRNRGMG